MLSLPTAWVRIPTWACEKVSSDLGLGGDFRRVLELATIAINVTKNRIQIQMVSLTDEIFSRGDDRATQKKSRHSSNCLLLLGNYRPIKHDLNSVYN